MTNRFRKSSVGMFHLRERGLSSTSRRFTNSRRVLSTATRGRNTKCLNFAWLTSLKENADRLAGPSPSPLAASLALTVALCEADLRMRQISDPPLKSNNDGQRHLDRAMRRYLHAIKTLAVIHRLNLPPIQVNVAEQQVIANR